MADSEASVPSVQFQDRQIGHRRISLLGSFGEFNTNSKIVGDVVASANPSGPSVLYERHLFSSDKLSFEKTVKLSAGFSRPFKVTLRVEIDPVSVEQNKIGPLMLRPHNDGTQEVLPPTPNNSRNQTIYRIPWTFDFSGCCVLVGPWGEKTYAFSILRTFSGGNPAASWRLNTERSPEKISLVGHHQLSWGSPFIPRLLEDIVDGIPITVYSGGETWGFNYANDPFGVFTDKSGKIVEGKYLTPNPTLAIKPKRETAHRLIKYRRDKKSPTNSIEIKSENMSVSWNDKKCSFSRSILFKLFCRLHGAAGIYLPFDTLRNDVWGQDASNTDGAIHQAIKDLKKELRACPISEPHLFF